MFLAVFSSPVSANSLIVAAEEFPHRHDDIYLRSTVFHSEGRLCHFHLYERLGRGETARNAGNLYAIYLQRIAYHAGKARIYANSGYMGQGGVGFIELIHFLGECHDALIRVLCIERGEFHASHKEFLHFEGVVLRHFFSNDSLHFFLNSSIIDVYIIFVQYFFDFALRVLSVFFYQFHSH